MLSITTAHVQAQNDAVPEISTNGMAGTANLSTADSLFIEIELEANQTNCINGNWWMIADVEGFTILTVSPQTSGTKD